MSSKTFVTISGSLVIVAFCGCRSFDLKTGVPWAKDAPDPLSTQVARFTGSWKDTTVFAAGKSPQRGFGGRLYFHNRNDEPVKVDGQLVVYAYDDSNGHDPNRMPDRRFVITREQLESHYSESSIGPSYSVWLPWDGVNGPTRQINLLPTFVPKAGQVVVASEARLHLPGPHDPRQDALSQHGRQAVQAASYQKSDSPFASRESEPNQGMPMKETTIHVPASTRTLLSGPRDDSFGPLSQSMAKNGQLSVEQVRQYYEAMDRINANASTESMSPSQRQVSPLEKRLAIRSGPSTRRASLAPSARPFGGPPRWTPLPAGRQFVPQTRPDRLPETR